MNACLELGAVEQSSYSVNIQIQKTAAGWCRGLWPPGGGVWLAVSSRLVQRDTVRSSGYLQPYSYFYHLHSVSYFIALQSAHTFYVEHTYLTMCGLTVLRIWQILWRWYLHLQSNAVSCARYFMFYTVLKSKYYFVLFCFSCGEKFICVNDFYSRLQVLVGAPAGCSSSISQQPCPACSCLIICILLLPCNRRAVSSQTSAWWMEVTLLRCQTPALSGEMLCSDTTTSIIL